MPQAVKDSATGVLRMVVLYKPGFPLSGKALTEKKEWHEKHPGFISEWAKKVFDECEKNKAVECKYPFTASATAFVVKDRRTIVTARHNFNNGFLDEVGPFLDRIPKEKRSLALNDYASKFVDVILLTEKGDVVFDSRKEGKYTFDFLLPIQMAFADPQIVAKFDFDFEKSEMTKVLAALVQDFVVIGLSKDLAEGIKPIPFKQDKAIEKVTAGRRTFAIGFPGYSLEKEDPKSQVNGWRLNASEGKVLSSKDFADAAKVKIREEKELKAFDYFGIATTNAALPGMSGGPILDEEGHLLSVMTAEGLNSSGWRGVLGQHPARLSLQK